MAELTWFTLQQFWNQCTQCALHKTCVHHVVGDGHLPCDVLIIGEGPGAHEDATGETFTGQSGAFLRNALELSADPDLGSLKIFLTNLVACRPHDWVDGPNRPPSQDELLACAPRLHQIWSLAQPTGVILLGRTAQHHGRLLLFHRMAAVVALDLPQPAALLRRGGEKSADYEEYLTKLRLFFQTVLTRKGGVQ